MNPNVAHMIDPKDLPTSTVSSDSAKPSRPDTSTCTEQYVTLRGHSQKAIKFYKMTSLVDPNGDPIETLYRYPSFLKHRVIATKDFYSTGEGRKNKELFGQDLFSAGSGPHITITEGEEDAVAVYEMFAYQYPAVSVRSSATAKADCTAQYDYIDSFPKIYLCFDSDKAGEKALREVASLFPYKKVYIVKKTKFKDANDYLINGAVNEYQKVWNNAKRYSPENLVGTFQDFKEILEEANRESIGTYPFSVLQNYLRGIRVGETVLFKGLEGIGKTELLGAIEYHLLETTDLNIGIIHLEEPNKRTLHRFATYKLGKPIHLDPSFSNERALELVEQVCKRDERLYLYKNLGTDDLDEVIDSIRFLVAGCGCKVVFLDHISRLVSGNKVDDERKALDYITTKLSQLTEELEFALLMISHVNDDGKTRGSRNISKEAYSVIHMDRDLTSEDEITKNTTHLIIEKNRFGSLTGPAGKLYFDFNTFQLTDAPPENKSVPALDKLQGTSYITLPT